MTVTSDTQQLTAQVRCLTRQGASLAADRNYAYDGLERYEDGLHKAMATIEDQRQTIDQLKGELERCRNFRHKLLVKIKTLKEQQAKQ